RIGHGKQPGSDLKRQRRERGPRDYGQGARRGHIPERRWRSERAARADAGGDTGQDDHEQRLGSRAAIGLDFFVGIRVQHRGPQNPTDEDENHDRHPGPLVSRDRASAKYLALWGISRVSRAIARRRRFDFGDLRSSAGWYAPCPYADIMTMTLFLWYGGLAAAAIAGLWALRWWAMTWGMTSDELRRAWPGDEISPHPIETATRAISI